jgi:hypothetical protein
MQQRDLGGSLIVQIVDKLPAKAGAKRRKACAKLR